MFFGQLTSEVPPFEVEFPRLVRHIQQAIVQPGGKVFPDAVFYSDHAWALSSAERDALVYEGRLLLAREPFPSAELSALLNHSLKGEDILKAWLGCLVWRIANPHRDFDTYCQASQRLRPGFYSLGRHLTPIAGGDAPETERIQRWMEIAPASNYRAFVREASAILFSPKFIYRQEIENALQRCFPSSQAARAWLANVLRILSLHHKRKGLEQPSALPSLNELRPFLTASS